MWAAGRRDTVWPGTDGGPGKTPAHGPADASLDWGGCNLLPRTCFLGGSGVVEDSARLSDQSQVKVPNGR